jgi:hypothetical protein
MYVALLPAMASGLGQVQKSIEAKVEQQRAADLKAIDEKAKSAESDQEKAELDAERRAILARPKPMDTSSLMTMGMNDPQVIPYFYADFGSAILLNVLMLAAGIGLVLLRSWGRTLGVWTAALKILRLIVIEGYFAIVVVPLIAQGMAKGIANVVVQQQQAMGRPAPGVPPVEMLQKTYAIMYTMGGVGMVVFGSIYPAI